MFLYLLFHVLKAEPMDQKYQWQSKVLFGDPLLLQFGILCLLPGYMDWEQLGPVFIFYLKKKRPKY